MLKGILQAVKGLLGSKKFQSAVIGSIVVGVCDHFGVDKTAIVTIASLFGIHIYAQGQADAGKK